MWPYRVIHVSLTHVAIQSYTCKPNTCGHGELYMQASHMSTQLVIHVGLTHVAIQSYT